MPKRSGTARKWTLMAYALFALGLSLMAVAVVVIVATTNAPEVPEVPTNNGVTVLRAPALTPETVAPSTTSVPAPGISPQPTTGVTVPPQTSRVADRQVAAKPMQSGARISIPSIGVDASIVSLGLNRDGTLQVPTSFRVAGWWSGGPFPGQPGPAVVVGHVSSVSGPGVFYKLGLLKPGDLITVSKSSTSSATFSVTRLLEVSKSDFPTQLVYGPVSDPELRLITCGGAFDSQSGHFVDNLIVFATLAPEAG